MKFFSLPSFIACFLLSWNAHSQSVLWKSQITTFSQLPSPQAEYKAVAKGPDGRIYATGYFHGFRAKIGTTILKSDSTGFISHYQGVSGIGPEEPSTLFLSCHEPNGTLAWAKCLTSREAYNASFLNMHWGTVFLSGEKLMFDTDGNLVMAGSYIGDTLSYDGVPFENNPSDSSISPRMVLIKTDLSGNLLWGRSQTNLMHYPRIKGLWNNNGTIEVLYYRGDPNPGSYTMLRYSANGNRLPLVPYQPQFTNGNLSWLFSTHRLENGNHLLASFIPGQTGGNNSSVLSVVNSDLSPAAHTYISAFYSQIQANSSPVAVIWPSNIRTFPDGQIGLMMQLAHDASASDLKVVLNSDTLDLPNLSSHPFKSLFIRLSGTGCMKNVALLDSISEGENTMTPNGNWAILLDKDYLNYSGMHSPVLALVDRNGVENQRVSLGNLGRSLHLMDEGPGNQRYSLKWRDGGIVGCYGAYLFRVSLPDPVVADESFSGCLSNRNLILANAKPGTVKAKIHAFESRPGSWEIQGLSGSHSHYRMITAYGQTLAKGSTSGNSAIFHTGPLSGGLYYLQVQQDNGIWETIRLPRTH